MDRRTSLLVSVLCRSIGAGYALYGRKPRQVVPLLTGLALCVYPYVVSNGYTLLGVGLLLTAGPWFLRN